MSQFPFTPFLLIFLLLSEVSCHGGSDHNTPSSSYPDLRSRSLLYAKLWSLLIVFAGTFAGGISPYFLKWNRELLAAGTEFAGGVFLSTAMIHFLSDANETFTDLTSISYPFAFMLACVGYLITMLADSLVFCAFKMRSKCSEVEAAAQVGEEGCRKRCKEVLGNVRLGDAIVMVAALCFHSVFEGIAIGVASTRSGVWRALWTVCLHKVFAAVAMGIAILQMMPKRRLISCLAYSFAFSVSTPVGVAIGILIDATTEGVVADWVYAISMGIACGVFTYVSINHLMSKDHRVEDGVSLGVLLRRFIAVSFGVAVIAVVMIWDT